MAERRPLVSVAGVMSELPTGDTLPVSAVPAAPRTMSATTAASVDGTVAGDMQITCTGDTVITPTGNPNGRMMLVEALASGAQRAVSVATGVLLNAGVTSRSLTVPAGRVGVFGLRFSTLAGGWLLMAADVTGASSDTTPPAVPTGLGATAGNGQVTLDWADNTEPDLAGYDYRVGTTNPPTGSPVRVTASAIIVTGLTNSTAYFFDVRAVDNTGNASAYSTAVTATPTGPAATVPSAPAAPTGTAGNGQVALTWTAPADGGAAITDYVVQSSLDAGTTWVTFADGTSTATSTTVTGLTNGTAYVFRVAAVNSVGQGAYSAASTAVTPAATAPGAPTAVTGTAGNTQVALSWTAPVSNGGSALTDYTVQYSSNSGSTWSTFTDAVSTATTATVTGLTNGTAYIFRVAAVNAVGTGAYSANSAAVTPAGGTTITDDFTGTAGVNLSGRAAGWSTGATDFVISPSGTTAQKATTTTAALNALVGPLSTSNNESSATIPSRAQSGNVAVITRANSAGDTWYGFRTNGTGVLELQRSIAGTVTVLATSLGTFTAGDRLTVRAVGDQITALRNGTALSTVTDTGITTGTYCGIRAAGAATQATFDDYTGADA